MNVRIIADSTADLMPNIKEQVQVVPLTVHFGEQEYLDGVTIDKKEFYEKLIESDVLPTTSQATPDAFMTELDKAKEAGDSVVVITLSAQLSGTYQSAVAAAEGAERDLIELVAVVKVAYCSDRVVEVPVNIIS